MERSRDRRVCSTDATVIHDTSQRFDCGRRICGPDERRRRIVSVFEAADYDEALAQLAGHPEIDVLFTDVQLSGSMDGLTLTRTLTATRPDLNLIVTSGRRRPRDTDLPDRATFVPKPYQIDAVAQLIARMAAGFGAN
jgi:CheY-like chemotaxis protein